MLGDSTPKDPPISPKTTPGRPSSLGCKVGWLGGRVGLGLGLAWGCLHGELTHQLSRRSSDFEIEARPGDERPRETLPPAPNFGTVCVLREGNKQAQCFTLAGLILCLVLVDMPIHRTDVLEGLGLAGRGRAGNDISNQASKQRVARLASASSTLPSASGVME